MARVAVFCGSRDEVAPALLAEAEALGEDLARAGHEVIYGGAKSGLMGRVAAGAQRFNGKVHGILPELDFALMNEHETVDQKTRVQNLAEGKALMLRLAEAAIVLPGGIGTLDELFEVLALKQTGQWPKPLWLYDFLDFWQPLHEALVLIEEQGMIGGRIDDLISLVQDRKRLMQELARGVGRAV